MSLMQFLSAPKLTDERGSLVVIENDRSLPFSVKRVYYVYGTAHGVSRGFHAHKALKQAAVCVSGKCRMIMDDGIEREEVWLDSAEKLLLIDKMIWHEMHDFSPDCVLLVLADNYYDEADYIRDYEKFKEALVL